MKFIHNRGAPMSILMVILAMMFCVTFASADQSADISQQAIINVVKIDGINNSVNFNPAQMDGIAVYTELIVDYRWENVVSTSDSVGILVANTALVNYRQFSDDLMNMDVVSTTNTAITNSFIYMTMARGALMPGDNFVIQQFANTASNMQGLGDSVGILVVDHDINVIHKI